VWAGQDQRVGEPAGHRAATRQPPGASVRHVRRAAGPAPAQQPPGELRTAPSPSVTHNFLSVCVCTSCVTVCTSCVTAWLLPAGPPAHGVLHHLGGGQRLLQPLQLRLRPPGHRLEHQRHRAAAGQITSPQTHTHTHTHTSSQIHKSTHTHTHTCPHKDTHTIARVPSTPRLRQFRDKKRDERLFSLSHLLSCCRPLCPPGCECVDTCSVCVCVCVCVSRDVVSVALVLSRCPAPLHFGGGWPCGRLAEHRGARVCAEMSTNR